MHFLEFAKVYNIVRPMHRWPTQSKRLSAPKLRQPPRWSPRKAAEPPAERVPPTEVRTAHQAAAVAATASVVPGAPARATAMNRWRASPTSAAAFNAALAAGRRQAAARKPQISTTAVQLLETIFLARLRWASSRRLVDAAPQTSPAKLQERGTDMRTFSPVIYWSEP